MRAAFHDETAHVERLRTFVLVVTPYLLGLVPISELFIESARVNINYFELGLVIITLLLKIHLLFKFWRNRQILKQTNLKHVMSSSLLARLFAFCVYRFIFVGMLFKHDMKTGKVPDPTWALENSANNLDRRVTSIVEVLYPVLVFGVLGLQQDILQVWFPCLWKTPRAFIALAHAPNNLALENMKGTPQVKERVDKMDTESGSFGASIC